MLVQRSKVFGKVGEALDQPCFRGKFLARPMCRFRDQPRIRRKPAGRRRDLD
jgi:hypothetical protein